MEKLNTNPVESNENVTTVEPTLELEVRRSRKIRTSVKAGLADGSRTMSGRTPITF
ncbi:hypothetical protein AKJ09_10450 [Labilithrix luteola]|uniref:Uncharacterized protein n=1 Tax=Labilithrix luteola TaxID=1391654 RepID=A0A0K1QDR1_9BACT|nr:hypothetical protein [Labilithrix luteola]AKV03787.1 hypothetical protein AKJ09_10450 [Labilithrix luteola]